MIVPGYNNESGFILLIETERATHAASDTICGAWLRAGHRSHDGFGAGQARSHGPADRGAQAADLQRAGRAQRQAAAAVRGQGAQGSTQCRHRADRRHRLRRAQHVRRSHPHADDGPACRSPACASTTSTPPRCARRRAIALKTGRNHHTANTGSIMETATAFPGNTGQNPEQRRAAGGNAAAQRLQHRRFRQVARNRRLGDQRVGPVRPLAHPPGLRQVLRLHRRRDRPVVSADLRRRDQGRSAEDEGLPLHRRHDQPGHQLGESPAVDDAGQAVLRLLRDRGGACAAPRAEGVGGQVQGPVRQGLGPGSQRNARAAEEAGRDPGEHPARRPAEGHQGLGLAAGGPAASVRPPGRGVRRIPGAHRSRDRALQEGAARTSASSTTRCSSTSPATTAPAPRAASSACTTR